MTVALFAVLLGAALIVGAVWVLVRIDEDFD